MTDINPISFQADGTPYSEKFSDIYFDSHDGIAQSEAVFIDASNVEKKLANTPKDSTLTVAETGFGTGLNFLLTLRSYQKLLESPKSSSLAQLHFISTEKYPLTHEELSKSLAVLSSLNSQVANELVPLAQQLISQYQTVDKDKRHARYAFFDNKVLLTLFFDDAVNAFSAIELPRSKKQAVKEKVDVWYLDGFSPAKNPEMWRPELLEQIARLSNEQATLSTFTVAGFVKRGLTDVGFRMAKQAIDCKKEHCLAGVYQSPSNSGKGYQLRPTITKPQHIAIIGGGIASACAAYLCTKNGIKVTLYCQDAQIAQGASSNAIGALFPLLHQQQDEISNFYQQAFWRARTLYQEVLDNGFHFAHDWCGLLEISYKDTLVKRQAKFAELGTWPKELIHSINAEQASKKANINLPFGGLFMPNAGWIAPQELVQQLFKAAEATGRLRLQTNIQINTITKQAGDDLGRKKWRLNGRENGKDISFAETVVVLAGGAEGIDISYAEQLPMAPTRGQVTSMKTNESISNLATVICHKGYLTPKNNGIHCIGATFQKQNTSTETTKADDDFNLAMLEKCLPKLVDWQPQDIASSKARLRCMTPDHLPMVGPMPDIECHKQSYSHLAKDKNWRYNQAPEIIDNIYVMSGFGARGLCSAPLCADILLADLCGTPYPVDNEQLFNLSPNRFVIRDIIKRKFD